MKTLPNQLQNLPTISIDEIYALREQNHVVYVYPRKQIVSVDGSKVYRIIKKPGELNPIN